MIELNNVKEIYLVSGYTDMRKQIDGLISIIKNIGKFDLTTNTLFIFCGKDKTKIKILEIDQTGVWVYYKRTHGQKFKWPKNNEKLLITKQQLSWFLQGLSVIQKNAHTPHFFNC